MLKIFHNIWFLSDSLRHWIHESIIIKSFIFWPYLWAPSCISSGNVICKIWAGIFFILIEKGPSKISRSFKGILHHSYGTNWSLNLLASYMTIPFWIITTIISFVLCTFLFPFLFPTYTYILPFFPHHFLSFLPSHYITLLYFLPSNFLFPLFLPSHFLFLPISFPSFYPSYFLLSSPFPPFNPSFSLPLAFAIFPLFPLHIWYFLLILHPTFFPSYFLSSPHIFFFLPLFPSSSTHISYS